MTALGVRPATVHPKATENIGPIIKIIKTLVEKGYAPVNLRNTPEITFIMDQSIEYGVNMSHKIDEAIGKHGAETEDITDGSDDSEE